MRKVDEIYNKDSCWNKANDNELVFVLLARDPAMSVAIRAWVEERVRLGKNVRTDAQIIEAVSLVLKLEGKA